MDIIIAQFKSDFKDRFKCDFPDSHLLSLIIHELDERKRSMIKDQLLGRTTEDLINICALLEKEANQSLGPIGLTKESLQVPHIKKKKH